MMNIDGWLWGSGYSEYVDDGPLGGLRWGVNYPALPEPIQHQVPCAGCGKPVPPEDHYALEGEAYHRVCLPEHPLLVKEKGEMTEFDKWQCCRCEEEFECTVGKMPFVCPNPNCGKKGPFKALTGPFVFFDNGKFVPKRLADDILKDHHIVTHRTSWIIYFYRDGCYQPDGEAAIRELCRERLGALAKENHINEVVKQIRDTTFKLPQDFNPPPHLVCLENGILDTETRELALHTPDRIFLQKLPVKYDPDAECPTVVKRLLEWTDERGLVKLIQFAGFCLYRDYFIRKAIIIHGEGGNGKTTLVLFLIGWLGEDNIAGIKVQNLEKRFMGGRLIGKLANICDDLPSDAWFNTGAFKQLTGGSPIEAEQKFKEGFLMKNYAKALFTANRLPIVSDESAAFWDRITIILFGTNFSATVPRENIVSEMLAEGAGFLNLALDGLEMLRTQNEFYGGDDNETTKKKYIKLSDPIMAFAHERTIESPFSRIPKADVYAAYVEYCTTNGFPVKENNAFARSFKRIYPRLDSTEIVAEDGKRLHAWAGVDLASNDGANTPNPPLGGVSEPSVPRDTQVSALSLLETLQKKYNINLDSIVSKPVEPVKPKQENGTKKPVKPVKPEQPTEPEVEKLGEGRKSSVTFTEDYPGGLVPHPDLKKPRPKDTVIVLPSQVALELKRKFGYVEVRALQEAAK